MTFKIAPRLQELLDLLISRSKNKAEDDRFITCKELRRLMKASKSHVGVMIHALKKCLENYPLPDADKRLTIYSLGDGRGYTLAITEHQKAISALQIVSSTIARGKRLKSVISTITVSDISDPDTMKMLGIAVGAEALLSGLATYDDMVKNKLSSNKKLLGILKNAAKTSAIPYKQLGIEKPEITSKLVGYIDKALTTEPTAELLVLDVHQFDIHLESSGVCTLARLADVTKFSQASICDFRRGLLPTPETRRTIAAALKCDELSLWRSASFSVPSGATVSQ